METTGDAPITGDAPTTADAPITGDAPTTKDARSPFNSSLRQHITQNILGQYPLENLARNLLIREINIEAGNNRDAVDAAPDVERNARSIEPISTYPPLPHLSPAPQAMNLISNSPQSFTDRNGNSPQTQAGQGSLLSLVQNVPALTSEKEALRDRAHFTPSTVPSNGKYTKPAESLTTSTMPGDSLRFLSSTSLVSQPDSAPLLSSSLEFESVVATKVEPLSVMKEGSKTILRNAVESTNWTPANTISGLGAGLAGTALGLQAASVYTNREALDVSRKALQQSIISATASDRSAATAADSLLLNREIHEYNKGRPAGAMPPSCGAESDSSSNADTPPTENTQAKRSRNRRSTGLHVPQSKYQVPPEAKDLSLGEASTALIDSMPSVVESFDGHGVPKRIAYLNNDITSEQAVKDRHVDSQIRPLTLSDKGKGKAIDIDREKYVPIGRAIMTELEIEKTADGSVDRDQPDSQ